MMTFLSDTLVKNDSKSDNLQDIMSYLQICNIQANDRTKKITSRLLYDI